MMTNKEAIEFASKNSFQALYAKGVTEGYEAGLKDGYAKALADFLNEYDDLIRGRVQNNEPSV